MTISHLYVWYEVCFEYGTRKRMIWQEGRGRVQEQEFDWKRGRKSAKKDEKGRKERKRWKRKRKRQDMISNLQWLKILRLRCARKGAVSLKKVLNQYVVMFLSYPVRCHSGALWNPAVCILQKWNFIFHFTEAALSDVLEYYQFTEAAPPDASEPHISWNLPW